MPEVELTFSRMSSMAQADVASRTKAARAEELVVGMGAEFWLQEVGRLAVALLAREWRGVWRCT